VGNLDVAKADWPTASPYVPASRDLTKLRRAVDDCEGCPLYRDATQAVFGAGPRDARVVLVGEQPGDHEDRAGTPFVGPAGRLLDSALEEAGIDRSSAYVTNAVKHFKFTPAGKRRIHATPDTFEVAACKPWLLAELSALKPELVVLLGATAAKSLLGPSFRVTKSRGVLMPAPDGDGQVLATLHPSAVLRASDRAAAKEGLVADLRVAADALAGMR
jgi:uracil-DNA glycosylase family protein